MFPLQPLQEATPIRWAGGGVPLSPGTSRQHLILGFVFGLGELRTQPPGTAGGLGGEGPEAAKMASQIAGLRSVSLPSSPSDGPMPEDKEYWDGLALLYSAMTRSKDGDHSVAIEQYTLALQLFKKLAELESDRKTEAKGLYVATLSLRGDSYKAKREFEIALADYNMALELRPENVQAYMGRADLYESMGERERAIADYQKALAVGPNMLAQFVGQCTDALKRLGTIH